MSVPSAVRRQAEQAEALQKQYASRGEGAQADGQPQPGEPNPPNGSGEGGEVDWEKRWKNLKASHDETVTDLRNQNASLRDEVSELKELVKKAVESPAPAAAQPDITFSDEEVDEYGEDFLNMVKRVATQIVHNSNDSQVASKIEELENRFGEVVNRQVKSDQDRYFDGLDAAIPGWEKIGKDQRFKDWLAEEMPLTGFERQYFLDKAKNSFDVNATVSIFNAWKEEVGLPTVYPDTHTFVNSDVDLGGGGEDRKIWTGAEIEKFYDDKRRGKYRGREAEARQLEEKIFLAQQQGRVRK